MPVLELLNKVVEIVSEYGQFPLGVIVGIVITRHMDLKVMEFSEKEKAALRQEKSELMEMLSIKDQRIEKLHDKIDLKNQEV